MQREIIGGKLCRQHQTNVFEIGRICLVRSFGRFDGPPPLAPKVHLVAHVEGNRVVTLSDRTAQRNTRAGWPGSRKALPGGGGIDGESRKKCRVLDRSRRARLIEMCERYL